MDEERQCNDREKGKVTDRGNFREAGEVMFDEGCGLLLT